MVSQTPPNNENTLTSVGNVASGGNVPSAIDAIPSHDRLYLNADGTIPGTTFTPQDLKINPFTGPQGGSFIDKRMLQTKQKAIYEQHHSKAHDNVSYGGIIIDPDSGKILMRQPSNPAYGGELTLPKGGADGNETPQEAALREVLEETGMKCKITGTVPGHYNSSGKSNQFFLMEVEENTGKFDDETTSVDWLDPDDAYDKLGKKETDTTKRDIDAISAALHEYKRKNKRQHAKQQEKEHAKGLETQSTTALKDVISHFAGTGTLPDDFTTNPKYTNLLTDIAHHVGHPNTVTSQAASEIKNMSSTIMGALDGQYGLDKGSYGMQKLHDAFMSQWGGSAMKNGEYANFVAHVVAQENGLPETWHFGKPYPPSVDSSGEPIYRSPEDRKAYIKAYDEWKEGGSSVGELPSGERFNFEVDRKLSSKYKSTKKDSIEDKEYNSWDFRYKRDKKIQDLWDKNNLQQRYDSIREQHGKHGKDSNSEMFPEDLSNKEAGQKMAEVYVNHAQDLTRSILDAVYPDTSHFWIQRKTGSAREILGDYGPTGTKFSSGDMTNLGMPSSGSKEEVDGEGFKSYVHSGSLAGFSTNPNVWSGTYVIYRKANKRDFFQIPAISNTHHGGEQEAIVMNNPNNDVRVMWQNGKIWSGDWSRGADGNGLHPTNSHGRKGTVVKGITDPKTDYHAVLKKTGGALGSNPGGTYEDSSSGKKFYVKTDHEDRAAQEDLANKLYESAGINVPNTELVTWKAGDNGRALKSDWLEGIKMHTSNTKALQDRADIKHGFLVDAVLANRDFAGANYDNLGEHDGKFYRLDQGGALEFRAKGKKKDSFHDWRGDYLSELDGFTTPSKNAQSSHVFANMDSSDYRKAAENLIKLSNSTISDTVNDSALEPKNKAKMIDTLIKRRDNALEWAIEKQIIGYNSLEEVHKTTKILKSDEGEEIPPSIYIDEPQSERYALTAEEKKQLDKDWQELADYYEEE